MIARVTKTYIAVIFFRGTQTSLPVFACTSSLPNASFRILYQTNFFCTDVSTRVEVKTFTRYPRFSNQIALEDHVYKRNFLFLAPIAYKVSTKARGRMGHELCGLSSDNVGGT